MRASEFKARRYPPKEVLIEGLLNKRDLVALGGRRRHGKTSILMNLATALAAGRKDFLGQPIPRPARVQGIFLEDEPEEFQTKYVKVFDGLNIGEGEEERLDIVPRDLLPPTHGGNRVEDPDFLAFIRDQAARFRPDLIIMDNLTFLGDYNEAKVLQKVHEFAYGLAEHFNAAVVIPAHVRKRANNPQIPRTLMRDDPDGWFEEIMGSSNFINTFGSLWGVDRSGKGREGWTDFLGGQQRLDGRHFLVTMTMQENGWFTLLNNDQNALELTLNSNLRRTVWNALPKGMPLSHADLRHIAVNSGMGGTTWDHWWKTQLVPFKIAIQYDDKMWVVKDIKLIGS